MVVAPLPPTTPAEPRPPRSRWREDGERTLLLLPVLVLVVVLFVVFARRIAWPTARCLII